jgi:hypothetical protein
MNLRFMRASSSLSTTTNISFAIHALSMATRSSPRAPCSSDRAPWLSLRHCLPIGRGGGPLSGPPRAGARAREKGQSSKSSKICRRFEGCTLASAYFLRAYQRLSLFNLPRIGRFGRKWVRARAQKPGVGSRHSHGPVSPSLCLTTPISFEARNSLSDENPSSAPSTAISCCFRSPPARATRRNACAPW